MAPRSDDDPEAQIDRLYQLPLKSFTAERNALAARLREQGRPEDAERVKGLAKPSASAWAVNQLFWSSRREFDELIDSSDRLRALQARGVTPKELRDAMRDRREALAAALKRAEASLTAHGHAANADLKQRVATTLESLASYGSGRPAEIRPGRFTEDLAPPGFEALSGLEPIAAPHAGPTGGQPAPGADDESALAVQRQLERDVALRRRLAQEAQAAADEAARRLEGAEREQGEAERRLARANERVEEARAAAEKARASARQAAEELAQAERELQSSSGPRRPPA